MFLKMLNEGKQHIPEKNCAISSFEQPKGSPRSLTQPSSMAFSKFKPLRLTTHSISDLFALNTKIKINTNYVMDMCKVQEGKWLRDNSSLNNSERVIDFYE